MTSFVQLTPRNRGAQSVHCTPKRPFRRSQVLPPAETPECFNPVTLETPKAKRRISNKSDKDTVSQLTVAVRVRPMNQNELSCASIYNAVSCKDSEVVVKIVNATNSAVGLNHIFQYDHVFESKNYDQKKIFDRLGVPILDNAFKGYNSCLFAYGQTGSGKSYSMMGENIDLTENCLNDYAGIIPRFCYELFERISKLPETSIANVDVSYFEIYNEKIHDLLAVNNSQNLEKVGLKVREHPVFGPYVVNLTQNTCKTFLELYEYVQIGNKNRATASTFMNEKSSRSHSIFSIEFSISELNSESGDSGRRSKISLVDLAGSERLNSHNVNEEHHRQSVSINRSLLTLGKVIAALADQKKNAFVPYRDSILTWLLRESLGGNSLTSMLATITPSSSFAEETLSTLRYACQARSIINRARINEDPHDRLIRELRAEVERLRSLRKDYEQKTVSSISNDLNDSHLQERNELKNRLAEMEENLTAAQNEWQQKFLEAKRKQKEAETKKAELESNLRIFKNLENDVSISPYRSNFLDKLEDILTVENYENEAKKEIMDTEKWVESHNLSNIKIDLIVAEKKILIKDLTTNFTSETNLEFLKNRHKYNSNPANFLNCLEWKVCKKRQNIPKDLNTHLGDIRSSLVSIKPYLEDDVYKNAFNQLNEAFENFQNVIKKKRHGQKTVKFQL